MIPILIPAKAHSTRCPRKNFELLPYTARYLEEEGRRQDAVVIYDDEEMKELAQSLGLETFREITPNGGDERAASECIRELGEDRCFRLPLTQPLRSHGLLDEMEKKDANLVVSAQRVTERCLFYFDRRGFVFPSDERKGKMCAEYLMVDGAAYLTKASWMMNVKSNADFWREPFEYVLNKMPFLDVDTKDDMEKLKNLWKIR